MADSNKQSNEMPGNDGTLAHSNQDDISDVMRKFEEGKEVNSSSLPVEEQNKASPEVPDTFAEGTVSDELEQQEEGTFQEEDTHLEEISPPLADQLDDVILGLRHLEEMVTSLHESIGTLVKQQEIMQSSLRQLGTRVSDAASSLGAPRIRELYMRLLLLYDLVEPPPAHLSEESTSLCKMIATQIEQFLEANGIQRIETDGKVFDPNLHKPVKAISEADPSLTGRIVSTVRNGFRADYGVLRPAEVVIASAAEESSDLDNENDPEEEANQERSDSGANRETKFKEKE